MARLRLWSLRPLRFILLGLTLAWFGGVRVNATAQGAGFQAGAAKVVISDERVGVVNDPLYVKALVLGNDQTTLVIVTVDAVSFGEIGTIPNSYVGEVRSQLQKEFRVEPTHVLFNASHCHGIVRKDVGERTVEAVRRAFAARVSAKVGWGKGREDRIQENRRLQLKGNKVVDVRHRYALPPDAEVIGVGPIDPEVGVLRIDRADGFPLAALYTIACHPIMGLPNGENTADFPGFASKVIEKNLGEGVVALYIQGCAGDINPAGYKDFDHPRNAEPLGNLLGLTTMDVLRGIKTQADPELKVKDEILSLPRGDLAKRIAKLESDLLKVVQSIDGTTLNFKDFLPLWLKQHTDPNFPAQASHRYLQEKGLGRNHLELADTANRQNVEAYRKNIDAMEELSRIQVNLALLRKHHAQNLAANRPTIDAELQVMKIGDFVLAAFPGELTVEIGLGLKKASPFPNTYIAGCSNGYLYYTPTAKQLGNTGAAQEDCDCLVAPEWQAIFEASVLKLLKAL